MLRDRFQYTARELAAILGGYARYRHSGGAMIIDRTSEFAAVDDDSERAQSLLWQCGCRADRVSDGRDAVSYYRLSSCEAHRAVPQSRTMPARLLADMFALDETDRRAIIDANDPDIERLFDLAVSNIDPSAIRSIARDQSLTAGEPTVLEELLTNGASAALTKLRTVYEEIPVELRVSYRWQNVTIDKSES